MARPRSVEIEDLEPSRSAFEAHLWKAVCRGSVTAMRLWVDLHRDEFKESDGGPDLFGQVRDPEDG